MTSLRSPSSLSSSANPWVHHSWLSDVASPIGLYYRLQVSSPMAFLFDSVDSDSRLARFSLLGSEPWVIVRFDKGQATLQWRDRPEDQQEESLPFSNPLHFLRDLTARFDWPQQAPESIGTTLPLCGGWVGYLGYAATQYFDGIPQQENDPLQVPEGIYAFYAGIWVYDHLLRRLHWVGAQPKGMTEAFWQQLQEQPVSLRASSTDSCPLPPLALPKEGFKPLDKHQVFANWKASFSKEAFCDAVLACKELITQGEVFQIVLSQRFSQPFNGEALSVYRILQAINPSPYGFYLKCPGFTYLGASPETFLSIQQGEAMLKALAGTRPRGADTKADEKLALELKADTKEMAEHLMLVDLGRNDLGKHCEVGSVRWGEIAHVTRYSHVMHLTTELRGRLKPGKSAFDVFAACFPRGTLSGAPKIRAMQHLARLEPERRGLYSGAVGYFDPNGNMDAAIAIRSVLLKEGQAHINAGAGVVYDSVPEAEYEETRNKAYGVAAALHWANALNSGQAGEADG